MSKFTLDQLLARHSAKTKKYLVSVRLNDTFDLPIQYVPHLKRIFGDDVDIRTCEIRDNSSFACEITYRAAFRFKYENLLESFAIYEFDTEAGAYSLFGEICREFKDSPFLRASVYSPIDGRENHN